MEVNFEKQTSSTKSVLHLSIKERDNLFAVTSGYCGAGVRNQLF